MAPVPEFIHDAAEQGRAPVRGALVDMVAGFVLFRLWGMLGWLDVQQRYRRSMLGPFWTTLSLAAFSGGISLTYGALLKSSFDAYLPFLVIGMVTWMMLSSFLTDGCQTFIGANAAIKQMRAPLSMHVFRFVWRALLIFGHNAVLVVLVVLAFGIGVSWQTLLVIPGLAVLCMNGVAFAASLGTLSARFRDIPPFMASVAQMLFFISPILWRPGDLGHRYAIATFNPFYYLVELVRAPLLGLPLPDGAWTISLAFTALNLTIALLLYARFRCRIPYWL